MSTGEYKNLPQKLRSIETKKSALQNIIDVIDQIKCGEDGLRLLLILGKNTNQTEEQAVAFFEGIKHSFHDLSSDEVRTNLSKLQSIIQNDIDTILRLTREDNPNNPSIDVATSIKEGIGDILHQFLRRVQTSVSLIAILQQRSDKVEDLLITVPKQEIEQRIKELGVRQEKYITHAKRGMESMESDIKNLLKASNLPEAIAENLHDTINQLRENMTHLESKKTLDDLPYTFEDLSDDDEEYNNPGSSVVTKIESIEDSDNERGIFMQLITWITTPTDVSWKQAKTWQKNN